MLAIATERTPADETAPAIPSFLELEITGFCQLNCVHCYADSGPRGGRGTMATADWERVIDQAAAIGVRMVQFIGGCFRTRRVPWGTCLVSLNRSCAQLNGR